MATTLATRVRRSPVRYGLRAACGLLIVSLVVANLGGYARFLAFRATLDDGLASQSVGRTVECAWSFPFQESRCMVSVAVDEAELAAADRVPTSAIFGSDGWLRERYIAEVVRAQADSPVVERLVAEFRRIRAERSLDSDEYLELMVAAVQAIPYGDPEVDTMLAAEVLVQDRGVCTDKSLLLGSLLVHEGYETVMWIFPTQRHVALGVASDGACFRGTRYAFVETTAPSFVGQASPEYRAAGPVALPPAQVDLGGSRSYGSGDQVEVILEELRRLQVVSAAADGYDAYARTSIQHRDRYAARAMEQWIADATATFILTNTCDRAGVYSLLTASPPLPTLRS
jgi:hypothetical protein